MMALAYQMNENATKTPGHSTKVTSPDIDQSRLHRKKRKGKPNA
jgi:hypothetical protein